MKKQSKYKAEKTIIDGFKFDSKVEGEYYLHLKDYMELGIVKSFKRQPTYILQPKFITENGDRIHAIKYNADFEVVWHNESITVVDIKGYPTPEAKLKRKMFLYKFQEKELIWLSYVKKYGGWIDYFELMERRREGKK